MCLTLSTHSLPSTELNISAPCPTISLKLKFIFTATMPATAESKYDKNYVIWLKAEQQTAKNLAPLSRSHIHPFIPPRDIILPPSGFWQKFKRTSKHS